MDMTRTDRLRTFKQIDLYPVTCEALSEGRTDEDVVVAAIAGGARIVQLRDKLSSRRVFYEKALAIRRITAQHGTLMIVNDDLDIALAVGADGVHLGQDDLPVTVGRRLLRDGIVGVSTHSLEEALAAQAAGADYVNIGPVFPTATKANLPVIVGPELIRDVAPHLEIPFTVMGGITAANMDTVIAAGARRVAVVTAVTRAPDIADAVHQLRMQMQLAIDADARPEECRTSPS